MPLNKASADAASAAYCSAAGITDSVAQAKWQLLFEQVWSGIQANISIVATVPASSIVTTGSATTQTGPATPVNTTVVVS